VIYANKPTFCPICKFLGHSEARCKRVVGKADNVPSPQPEQVAAVGKDAGPMENV